MDTFAYLDVLNVTRWVPKPKALAIDVWADVEVRSGADIFLLTGQLEKESEILLRNIQSGLNRLDTLRRYVWISLHSDKSHPVKAKLKDNDVVINMMGTDNPEEDIFSSSTIQYLNLKKDVVDIMRSGASKKQTYLKVLEHITAK